MEISFLSMELPVLNHFTPFDVSTAGFADKDRIGKAIRRGVLLAYKLQSENDRDAMP